MNALDECVSAANHVEWLCLGITHDNQRMPDCPHVLIAQVHEASDSRMLVRHSHASGYNGDRATRGARHVPGRCGSSCHDRTSHVPGSQPLNLPLMSSRPGDLEVLEVHLARSSRPGDFEAR